MKFRDGMWLVSPSKRLEYAEEVYSIKSNQKGEVGLSLLCPTKPVRSRADTLNLSTLAIDLVAAFDGVLSIEVTHWAGAARRGPDYELFPDGQPECSASVNTSTSGETTLCAGALSATIQAEPHQFGIKFHATDGTSELTSLLSRSVGLAYDPPFLNPRQTEDSQDFKHYIFTQTELGVGESVYGLGERFGPLNKVGQSVSLWNEDGGTSSDQAYKNISFWLSNRGYGVFIDTPDLIELEHGYLVLSRYLIYGPTPKQVLTRYAVLTGKASMVPAWSFGLWLTTSFTTDYDEKTVTYFLEEMKARSCPVEVFHFDCFWLRAFHWCDFVFAQDRFPDPEGQISRMRERGLLNKTCVWINPYLGQTSPVFAEAAEKGYFLRRENGDVWQWDLWQAGMALVDFTNPAACDWYRKCLDSIFDVGIDAIKTDFGERIPTKGVKWFDSSVDPSRMHNYYAFIYNRLVFEALEKRFGKGQAVLFARSACAGTQRYPLCWGGDSESTAAALAESVRGGISLGFSGFSFWSCDIGGFEGSPPAWLYKRWVAVGLLCSHSRLHGSNSYRVPWLIDDPDFAENTKNDGDTAAASSRDAALADSQSSTAVLSTFLKLKRRLMPYLMAQAVVSTENSWPLSLRAMALEFPDDPTSWYLDRQFMIGESVLAAPIFTEDGNVEFYLPAGKWTSWWTGEVVVGPSWRKEKHGFDSLPLYVREGAILLVGEEEQVASSFDKDWLSSGGHVRLYHCSAGAQALVVSHKGDKICTLRVQEDKKVGNLGLLGPSWAIVQIN